MADSERDELVERVRTTYMTDSDWLTPVGARIVVDAILVGGFDAAVERAQMADEARGLERRASWSKLDDDRVRVLLRAALDLGSTDERR